jgi:acyl-CoA thioesterase-1
MQIPPNYGPFYSRRFAGIYKKVADSENAALVPFLLEGVAEDQSLFLDDGIHPNEKAQPIILQNVLNALK